MRRIGTAIGAMLAVALALVATACSDESPSAAAQAGQAALGAAGSQRGPQYAVTEVLREHVERDPLLYGIVRFGVPPQPPAPPAAADGQPAPPPPPPAGPTLSLIHI